MHKYILVAIVVVFGLILVVQLDVGLNLDTLEYISRGAFVSRTLTVGSSFHQSPTFIPTRDSLRMFHRCMEKGARNDGNFWEGGGAIRWRHNLTKSEHYVPIVVEVGGNVGEDSTKWVELSAEVVIIEPIPTYVAQLRSRFATNKHVAVLAFGLDYEDGTFPFCEAGVGSGAFGKCSNPVQLPVRGTATIVRWLLESTKRSHIDMMTINCEGCEYGLLEALIEADQLRLIKIIQFSRHQVDLPSLHARVCRIQEYLSRTHDIIYEFPWVWEAWKLRM